MDRVKLKIKNWDKYQAKPREDRGWKWIKVHRSILTDFHFRELSPADRWNLIGLWCLADAKTGVVDLEHDELLFMLGCKSFTVENLHNFVEILAAKPRRTAAKRGENAKSRGTDSAAKRRLEIERELRERDRDRAGEDRAKDAISVATRRDGFAEFWDLYPSRRKHNRAGCRDKYMRKTRPGGATPDEIITGLRLWVESYDWTKDDGQFVPLASTFLNQSRWESAPESIDISEGNGSKGLSL